MLFIHINFIKMQVKRRAEWGRGEGGHESVRISVIA